MWSLRLPICALVGIACWSIAVAQAGRTLRLAEDDVDGGRAQVEATTTEAQPPILEQKAVRSVNPDQFAAPFASGEGSLERIAPREAMAKEDVKPVEAVRLARPQTIEAGLMIFDVRTLRLAGVVVTERARTCTGADGATWPCGIVARTQQRLFLRNRTIDCDLPSAKWNGETVASCHIGGADISTWLAEGGWAEAEPGSALEPLTAQARAERRGIFGNDPRRSMTQP